MQTLHIIYASTSGHTEFVVTKLAESLRDSLSVTLTRAELATPEDFQKGDLLLLASSTWNTGGIEGQLNPHMHDLLKSRVNNIDLAGKSVALIALGDSRYRYTALAGEHLKTFVETHNGKLFEETLTIINEPYAQEEKIRAWGTMLLSLLT